jgi:holo-[acyl-carrier protein] synthase
MRIIGIGVDLVEVARIEAAIERWGERFLKRIFTPAEMEYCGGHTVGGIHYAARFAAKEAVRKATGEDLNWTDVEITNEERGKPVVRLSGRNLTGEEAENTKILLSISHTDEYAVAYVVVQATENRL